tara:strand:+ start:352 stop:663 length:312 start_codon:yes stop_codon:yes gene_type:complete
VASQWDFRKELGLPEMNQEEVQQFIEENINPGLSTHGGYLLVDGYDDETKILKIKMGGGCQGCSSSTATLKMMIEHLLREEFPKLSEVHDVTDHASGDNPYYV